MPEPDPFARLPGETRQRLHRFTAAVERVRVEELLALAARPFDPDAHAAALDVASLAARDHLRSAAVDRIRRDADEWVLRLYNTSTAQPGWYEANWGRPGTAVDRANLAGSLAEALTAVVLWDVVDESVRDELLGAWAALAT